MHTYIHSYTHTHTCTHTHTHTHPVQAIARQQLRALQGGQDVTVMGCQCSAACKTDETNVPPFPSHPPRSSLPPALFTSMLLSYKRAPLQDGQVGCIADGYVGGRVGAIERGREGRRGRARTRARNVRNNMHMCTCIWM